ncbi:MAG TPA: NAD(P)-binding domain-containing protein [Terrimesophilobacter sp.]|nr:NAD(P)-binding domain-containing protein [Terrimesophilobacter sp.]
MRKDAVRKPVIGILGAGKLGSVLARLIVDVGYDVVVGTSRDPQRIALTIEVLAPGATVATAQDVAARADIVILAIPLGKLRTVSADDLADKLVIDATNYWWEVDGFPDELTDPLITTSELVQRHLDRSRVVKALNHVGYHDIDDEARPAGASDRTAIGIAGDHPDDLALVARLVDDIGFDPVIVGALADGVMLEPGTEPFGASVGADELRAMVERYPESQRSLRIRTALARRAS